MIEEEDIVTVIGSPGCGKTTAIHHVALRLNKEQLYDVVPALLPSDIFFCLIVNKVDPCIITISCYFITVSDLSQ
jgi:MoxR-like ATPase